MTMSFRRHDKSIMNNAVWRVVLRFRLGGMPRQKKVKVKCATLLLGIGGMLISFPKAMSP